MERLISQHEKKKALHPGIAAAIPQYQKTLNEIKEVRKKRAEMAAKSAVCGSILPISV
jgi:hypothetical protein